LVEKGKKAQEKKGKIKGGRKIFPGGYHWKKRKEQRGKKEIKNDPLRGLRRGEPFYHEEGKSPSKT